MYTPRAFFLRVGNKGIAMLEEASPWPVATAAKQPATNCHNDYEG
ncbi:hypothetical protein [Methyloglobulus sp.]